MAIIIYGVKQIAIGLGEFLIKCPACETHSWADIMVTCKYFHLFWIPFFPIEKEAHVICKTCGLKRYKMRFDQKLISNYSEIKDQFKQPWFTYIGLIFVIVLLTFAILSSVF
jgi:hypothetical protein